MYIGSVNPDRPNSTVHHAENRVTGRYSIDRPCKSDDPNWRKLQAIVRLFALTPTQVARAAGVSRPYVSRLLNERDGFVGSSVFYKRLEAGLGRLLDSRDGQFFDLAGTSVECLEMILKDGGSVDR